MSEKSPRPKPSPVMGESGDRGVDLSLLSYLLGLSPLDRLALLDKNAVDPQAPPAPGQRSEKPRLLLLGEVFEKQGVELVVMGGTAAILWGSPLPTSGVDLCYRRTPENLRRLAEALREVHATLRGAPPDLKFRLDAESLALGSSFAFDTDFGPLHLRSGVEPLGEYDQLLSHGSLLELGPIRLRVIGLDDLIRVKGYLGRPQDRTALDQLVAIRRLMKPGREPSAPSDS